MKSLKGILKNISNFYIDIVLASVMILCIGLGNAFLTEKLDKKSDFEKNVSKSMNAVQKRNIGMNLPKPETNQSSNVSINTEFILDINRTNIDSILRNQKMRFYVDNQTSDVIFDLARGWYSLNEEIDGLNGFSNTRDDLFEKAINEFNKGITKNRYFMDELGRKHIADAYEYLLLFLSTNPDKDRRSVALLLLGDISSRLWHLNKDEIAKIAFIEVINENPGKELAQIAWKRLNENVRFGYTGSSGDNTPITWLNVLSELHTVANKRSYRSLFNISMR